MGDYWEGERDTKPKVFIGFGTLGTLICKFITYVCAHTRAHT